MTAGPITQRPFIAPRVGMPLKVIVHATTLFDPYGVAQKGIVGTLDAAPINANVLEVQEPSDRISFAYSGVNSGNSIVGGSYGFIYEERMIRAVKPYLDGAQDIIMMGGASTRCLRWNFSSILAAKAFGANVNINALFKGHERYKIWACETEKRGVLVENGRSINFHFNAEAVYPHRSDIINVGGMLFHADEDIPKPGCERYMDWKKMADEVSDFREQLHDANFRFMPHFYRAVLAKSGLHISEYIDGKRSRKLVSRAEDRSFKVRTYYWSSTEKLAEFFASRAKRGKA
ncbi:hypothetical protein ACFL4F_02210 [Candidatus Margulisiibacteriota bacterium]